MEGAKTAQKSTKNPIQDEEKVIELINLVKTYPCIWLDTDRQYKNIEIRHQAWQEIASVLEEDPQCVHAKWRNLMNSYRRTKKEIALSQTTGSGSSELLKEVWYAYEHMSFLHETTAPRRTINTANLEGTSREPVATSTAPATAASCSSTTTTTATTTATTSSTSSSSGMLEGRTASKGRKRQIVETRSSQISECLGAIRSIANTATAAAPCSQARALGNLVESQVATFENKHPQFCAKLIRSITTVMNDQIDQFYADQHASSMHDHAYL